MTSQQVVHPVFIVQPFPSEAGPCCCGGGEDPPGDSCCPDLPITPLVLKLTSDNSTVATLTYTTSLPNVDDNPPGWQAEYEGQTIEFYCVYVNGNWEWFLDDAEGGVTGVELICCGRVSFTGTVHGDVYIDLPACNPCSQLCGIAWNEQTGAIGSPNTVPELYPGETIYDLYTDATKIKLWWLDTGSIEDATRYVFVWYDQNGRIHVTHWSWGGSSYSEDDTVLNCETINWNLASVDLYNVNNLPLIGDIC
jgi:hypothetical protein